MQSTTAQPSNHTETSGMVTIDQVHVQRLQSFLSSTSIFCAVNLVLFLATYAWFRLPVLLFFVGVNAIVVTEFQIALALIKRQRLHQAMLIVASSSLMIVTLIALAFPALQVTVVIGAIAGVAIVQAYVHSNALRTLIVVTWLVSVICLVLANYVRIGPALPTEYERWLGIIGGACTAGLLLIVMWMSGQRLNDLLTRLQFSNAALRESQQNLQQQVLARTSELEQALREVEQRSIEQMRLLEETEQQRVAIRELSVPVLPIGHDALVMPLIGALDSARLAQVQEQALHTIEKTAARTLVLDITGVLVIDTFVAQGLINIVHSARLLGAKVILVGIRPEVAQAMVGLGINLGSVITHSDLRQGIAEVLRN